MIISAERRWLPGGDWTRRIGPYWSKEKEDEGGRKSQWSKDWSISDQETAKHFSEEDDEEESRSTKVVNEKVSSDQAGQRGTR